MYWRLRKMYFEYARRNKKLVAYDKTVQKVIFYRYAYWGLMWTLAGVTFGHYLFTRKDPISGKVIAVTPGEVTLWDLGENKNFDVYDIESSIIPKKLKVNPLGEFAEDEDL